MDKELRQQVLNEAVRIGDELLTLAEYDEHGLSWQTMSMDDARNISWHKSESLYTGVSGIALFFLELYRQTKNEKYRKAAVEGMHWVEHYCLTHPTTYYAFFTGRMGVSYAMLRLWAITGDSRYLETALRLAEPCATFLNGPYTVADLINGASGTLLGLLHLHAATHAPWLLEAIHLFIQHLLDKAQPGPAGLYWDRSSQNIRGLCGFSHGAAGIGFVFLELGRYFQNESFYWIAEQAFLYEAHCYDASKRNWPDFRKGIYKPSDYEEQEKAYLAQDWKFFTQGGDMNAWCHGAAGIGLSRIRAFELLKKPLYREEVDIAIKKTILTDIQVENPHPLYILCHGKGGNAELFLEAYRAFRDEQYLSWAATVAGRALQSKAERKVYLSGFQYAARQEDRSLFMGNAGIGYFYLELLEPLRVPSILQPKLESTLSRDELAEDCPAARLSTADLRRKIVGPLFKRTLSVAEKLLADPIKNYFAEPVSDHRVNEKERFISYMENRIAALPPREKMYISDIFDLELEKVRMDDAIRSGAWLHIKEKVQEKQAALLAGMDRHSFLNLRLVLDSDVKIKLTGWPWRLDSPYEWASHFRLESAMHPVLLKSSPEGIMEKDLSLFSYTVLIAFQNDRGVRDVIEEVINSFESVSAEQKKIIQDRVIEQINQAILSGILRLSEETS